MNLNVDTHWWGIVVDFLDGRLDHEDESTRREVATALFRIDHAAYMATMQASTLRTVEQWDEILCRITTEEPSTLALDWPVTT